MVAPYIPSEKMYAITVRECAEIQRKADLERNKDNDGSDCKKFLKD